MYSIYADDNLVYSPDLVSDGMFITNPTYEKEINKAGSCTFYIYPENPMYNAISALKTRISVKEDNVEVWRGRVLTIDMSFDKAKKIYCEGIYSFFIDSIVRPFKHTKTMAEQFTYIITQHNAQVENYKKFTVGTIDVDDVYGSKEWEATDYQTAKDLIEGILSDYGGYLVVSFSGETQTISYRKDPSRYSNQGIEFGENLLNLTDSLNPSNVFTVLIPIAYDANQNKITIESVNDGKDYLESESGIAQFGRIMYCNTFSEDISTPAELKQKGIDFLNSNIKASRTIATKAVDMHFLNPDIDRIDIFDLVKVHSVPHNLDEYQMCSKIKIDMEDASNNEYVIGTVPEGIESILAGNAGKTKTVAGSSLPNGDNVQY